MSNPNPKVSCLCCTKGRFGFLRKAIAYYDLQDYDNRELIIFNNHDVPITLSGELAARTDIRVINAGSFESIADVYNSAITFCEGKYTAIWDDDDMYFPWHLSTGTFYLDYAEATAWKPEHQLSLLQTESLEDSVAVISNSCEGSNIVRTDLLKEVGFGSNGLDPQHPHPLWQEQVGKWVYSNIDEHSYVYVWNGTQHLQGHLSQGMKFFAEKNTDTGGLAPLTQADVTEDYNFVFSKLEMKGIEEKYSEEDLARLKNRFEIAGISIGKEHTPSWGQEHTGLDEEEVLQLQEDAVIRMYGEDNVTFVDTDDTRVIVIITKK